MAETIIMDEVQALKNRKEAKKDGCRILDMAKYEKRRVLYRDTNSLIMVLLLILFFFMGYFAALAEHGLV